MYFTDKTDFLAHYGVMGMKWGVRKAETRKKYLNILKNDPQKSKYFDIRNEKDAKYAAKLEYKYGKPLPKKHFGSIHESRYFKVKPSKAARAFKDWDKMDDKYKKVKKSGKITKEEYMSFQPGLYFDQKSMAYRRQVRKAERTGADGIPVNMNYMTELKPKDVRKMLSKALKTDKKYSEISTNYIHRKRNKELATRLLKNYLI